MFYLELQVSLPCIKSLKTYAVISICYKLEQIGAFCRLNLV